MLLKKIILHITNNPIPAYHTNNLFFAFTTKPPHFKNFTLPKIENLNLNSTTNASFNLNPNNNFIFA